jgi:DNA-binding FrmR family transcriptional regulator
MESEGLAMTDLIPDFQSELARLRRIEGQVRGIQKMIRDGRDCVDILTQLAAADSALRRVEENIMARHLEGCVAGALESGETGGHARRIREIVGLLKTFRR